LPTRATSRWDFGRWKPDAVVIDLGTNDFSLGDPGAAFLTAHQALVTRVRQNYPSALIVIALGPMLSDLWPVGAQALTQARARLTALVAGFNAAGDPQVRLIEFPNQDGAPSFGCRNHPSAATHRQLADQLARFLRQQLGW
jgi:lysophospholipase L1-like esterase